MLVIVCQQGNASIEVHIKMCAVEISLGSNIINNKLLRKHKFRIPMGKIKLDKLQYIHKNNDNKSNFEFQITNYIDCLNVS